MLSRALYRFKHFDLRAVRFAERIPSLKLQLAAWSPFDRCEFAVGLRGSEAFAFAWDQDAVVPAMEEQGWSGVRVVLPEGLFRPAGTDGIRLLACLEGYEAQLWEEGRLLQSQWWPVKPDEAALQSFLRLRQAQRWVNQEVTPASVPWATRPWVPCEPVAKLEQSVAGIERRLAWLVAFGVAMFSGYQLHALARAHSEWTSAQSERDVVQARTAAGSSARANALELADRANVVARAMSGPQPLEIMAQLSSALPEKGALVQQLVIEPGKVRVVLSLAPDIPRSLLVQRIQSGGYFGPVREARDALPGGAVAFDLGIVQGADSRGPLSASAASGVVALRDAGR